MFLKTFLKCKNKHARVVKNIRAKLVIQISNLIIYNYI
jgi:hypothetical protein